MEVAILLDQLFEVGLAQQMGVFFFLFIALGALFWVLIRSVMKENNLRENRYIATIEKLAEDLGNFHAVKDDIEEIRKSGERQEHMIGRVLDRLPSK